MWDGAGDRAIIKINIVDDTERCNFAADIARARGVCGDAFFLIFWFAV